VRLIHPDSGRYEHRSRRDSFRSSGRPRSAEPHRDRGSSPFGLGAYRLRMGAPRDCESIKRSGPRPSARAWSTSRSSPPHVGQGGRSLRGTARTARMRSRGAPPTVRLTGCRRAASPARSARRNSGAAARRSSATMAPRSCLLAADSSVLPTRSLLRAHRRRSFRPCPEPGYHLLSQSGGTPLRIMRVAFPGLLAYTPNSTAYPWICYRGPACCRKEEAP
jgi:hypothetical protein